ncbi:DnaJ-like protein subfamily C member 2 [Nematocida major]|uniref:DnaJ-like protein subfamily C member 2 n=1 Tax=Nematocida major TaxID=1912982 RepID=UPI002007F1BA|nr:DnaJ-like protein subfamily C member 2 [Nematocida major]KAH9386090.1 DnaJ-like protein subfamily C member 2 [Nematocida major]
MRVTHYTGPRTHKESARKSTKKGQAPLKTPKDLFERYDLDDIKNWKSLDLYYLLGIDPEEAQSYTETKYKEAFRKQAKMFHPDRLLSCKIEDGGLSFIALTKAHEVLSNPHKRRLYDFVAFDEAIPEDRDYTNEEFFCTFTEIFERNSRLSSKPCTVVLGDLNTKDSDIVAFYKFWKNFESIRTFEFLCNDEDYQSREMRRHAAAQNKKMLDEKKMEDSQRIRKLVSLAIKHDPRVNKESKGKPKEEVTIDEDGWKSTEVDALTKIAIKTPARTRCRLDVIFSALSRHAPTKSKKDVQTKLLKVDAAIQKGAKK